jgi:arsenate reductase-like glutaredoxin family protein
MSLSRDEWKKRLKDAEIDPDLAETFVDGLSDDQLVRMKEASLEQVKEAVSAALTKCFTGSDETETRKKEDGDEDMDEEEEETKKKDDATSLKDLMDFANYIIAQTEERVVAKVKDMLEGQEIEVEVPLLTDMQNDIGVLKEAFDGIGAQLKDLVASDTERIKENFAGMSDASKARMRRTFSTDAFKAVELAMQRKKEQAEHLKGNQSTPAGNGGAIIKDAAGNTFSSLEEFATGD